MTVREMAVALIGAEAVADLERAGLAIVGEDLADRLQLRAEAARLARALDLQEEFARVANADLDRAAERLASCERTLADARETNAFLSAALERLRPPPPPPPPPRTKGRPA